MARTFRTLSVGYAGTPAPVKPVVASTPVVAAKPAPVQVASAPVVASASIPSPSHNDMFDAVRDPIAYRHKSLDYERNVIQTRESPRTPTPFVSVPDLTKAINDAKGKRS